MNLNKDNRDKAGALFYPKNLGVNKKRASVLKKQIEEDQNNQSITKRTTSLQSQ